MWGVGNLFGRTGGDERMAGTLVRDNRGTASPARAEREEGRAIDKDGETGPDGSPYARSGRTDRNGIEPEETALPDVHDVVGGILVEEPQRRIGRRASGNGR